MPVPIERLLSEDYLDGLEGWPVEELRRRRRDCYEVETSLSYLRRLVHARLDIVLAERDRRRRGDEALGPSELIEQLPGILGDPGRAGGGRGQLAEVVAPPDAAELERQLDAVINADRLASLAELSDEDLDGVFDRLRTLERSVSDQRHAVHERLDDLVAEIVKRYKSGEATVDGLLS
jgi:hypothetical protein